MPGPARLPQLGDPLTPRQIQCLAGAAAGQTNARIARRLCLAEDTIKTHFRLIYLKTGIHDRTGAVWAASQQGVLTADHVQAARLQATRP